MGGRVEPGESVYVSGMCLVQCLRVDFALPEFTFDDAIQDAPLVVMTGELTGREGANE